VRQIRAAQDFRAREITVFERRESSGDRKQAWRGQCHYAVVRDASRLPVTIPRCGVTVPHLMTPAPYPAIQGSEAVLSGVAARTKRRPWPLQTRAIVAAMTSARRPFRSVSAHQSSDTRRRGLLNRWANPVVKACCATFMPILVRWKRYCRSRYRLDSRAPAKTDRQALTGQYRTS